MSVIVFDLDDTLYNEISFVHSGFKAVAEFLSANYGVDDRELCHSMCKELERSGRGAVFDSVLSQYGMQTRRNINQCISIYRSHVPAITLDPDAESILRQLAGSSLYIVTDGNKMVQHNKLLALNLYPKVKKCFVTHRYGKQYAKPSPYCFNKIAYLEEKKPSEIVYIGDNPHKDFVGIKPLGFRTVRINKGMFKDVILPSSYSAEAEIGNLGELLPILYSWGLL